MKVETIYVMTAADGTRVESTDRAELGQRMRKQEVANALKAVVLKNEPALNNPDIMDIINDTCLALASDRAGTVGSYIRRRGPRNVKSDG
jgi:hypothetical protein